MEIDLWTGDLDRLTMSLDEADVGWDSGFPQEADKIAGARDLSQT